MGTSSGEGKYVSKQEFISKYGGDFKKYLSLFRNFTIRLNRKNLRLKGIKEMNIHLITSIKHNGKPRTLEIYFENKDDIFKLEKLNKVIINGTLRFEKKDEHLQLISAKFIE